MMDNMRGRTPAGHADAKLGLLDECPIVPGFVLQCELVRAAYMIRDLLGELPAPAIASPLDDDRARRPTFRCRGVHAARGHEGPG